MGQLFHRIRRLVQSGRYLVTLHAVERLDERKMLEWQIVDGIISAALISERPDDLPHPSIETHQTLPDGTEVRVVWSVMETADIARLVTVYFIEP